MICKRREKQHLKQGADDLHCRDLAATYTFVNDLTTALAIQEVTEALNTKLQETVPDLEWIFSYTPLPAIATQQSLNRGGGQLGLDGNLRDLIGKPNTSSLRHTISHSLTQIPP